MMPGQELVERILLIFISYVIGYLLAGQLYLKNNRITFLELVLWPILPITLLYRGIKYLFTKEFILDKFDDYVLKMNLRYGYKIILEDKSFYRFLTHDNKTICQSYSYKKIMARWIALKV